MGIRICNYSTASGKARFRFIGLLFLLCLTWTAAAQQEPRRVPRKVSRNEVPQAKPRHTEPDTIPLYTGTFVGFDIFGLGSRILGSDYTGAEVGINVHLKNRFIPTLEIGMGKTDVGTETGIFYKSKSAPYFRIGMDYNTLFKKQQREGILYVGVRYAFSSFSYDIYSLPNDGTAIASLTDGIWNESVPFNYTGLKSSMRWLEFLVGVKIRVYRNFQMGWSIRMKYKTSASIAENGNPYHVPGYGRYGANTMGLTYSLIYKLPL